MSTVEKLLKASLDIYLPKKLLEAIKITHMTDNKGYVKAQLFEATELYGHDNEMGKLSHLTGKFANNKLNHCIRLWNEFRFLNLTNLK
jgi:hypothetical protein